jgi:hypothetical protein
MWLLLLVMFAAPMQIGQIDILGTHWSEKDCVKAVERARDTGIPKEANIGCVYVGTIKKT